MSVNKIILLGNAGRDPEIKSFENGSKVASFSLATTDKGYKKQDGTDVPEKTEWHNIVLWRGLAELAEKYIHKGDKVYVEGKLRTRSYEDKSGVKHYITEIYADSVELLSPKLTSQSAQPSTPSQPVNEYQTYKSGSASQDYSPKDDLPF